MGKSDAVKVGLQRILRRFAIPRLFSGSAAGGLTLPEKALSGFR